MKKVGKLVRDKIPERIEARGQVCTWHTAASEAEYKDKLELKLMEEVGEFVRDRALEELADVFEVLEAIIPLYGLDQAVLLDGYSSVRVFSAEEFDDKDLEFDLLMELDDLAMGFMRRSRRERLVELVRRLWEVAEFQGFRRDELERVRLKKRETHGAFEERIILDEA